MSIQQFIFAKKAIGQASRADLGEAQTIARDNGLQNYGDGKLVVANFENAGAAHKFLVDKLNGGEDQPEQFPLKRNVIDDLVTKIQLAIQTKDDSILPEHQIWYMENVGYLPTVYWFNMEIALVKIKRAQQLLKGPLKGWSAAYYPSF